MSHHYRCDPRIIEFNNKKYYNGKLKVETYGREKEPLLYVDIQGNTASQKNTAPAEAERIVEYVRMNRDKKIGIITPFANQKNLLEERLREYNITDVTCGTVHAFQGDQKDVILFSLAVTNRTQQPTYQWLKNNKELINVAVSRAKEKLIVLSGSEYLGRLHGNDSNDDIYELVEYVRTNGRSQVTEKTAASRTLGVKPYSTETEEAFLTSLNHALENVLYYNLNCVVHKEVGISHVFRENTNYSDLFYSGRFDFVVYQKEGKDEFPILAIELDGKEHMEDAVVKERDRMKQEICKAHNLELIRIDNLAELKERMMKISKSAAARCGNSATALFILLSSASIFGFRKRVEKFNVLFRMRQMRLLLAGKSIPEQIHLSGMRRLVLRVIYFR